MNGKKVVIGSIGYTVGDTTPDNFIVVKPQMVWLNILKLSNRLVALETRTRRPLTDPNHKELRKLCAECSSVGDRVAVEVVALREVDTNFAYKIICSCRGEKKLYMIAGSFLEQFGLQTKVSAGGQLVKAPRARMSASAQA